MDKLFFEGFEKMARLYAPRIKKILSIKRTPRPQAENVLDYGKILPRPQAENVLDYGKIFAADKAKRAEKLVPKKERVINYQNL